MLLDLPLIEQKTDFDCGKAAYQCVCRYWEARSKHLTPDKLLGTHPSLLEPTLRRTGFWVQLGSMTVDDLKHHASLYRPVICLIQQSNIGHYVVSAGVWRGKVYFMNPSNGEIEKMSFKDFEKVWIDVDKTGALYSQFGIAAWIE